MGEDRRASQLSGRPKGLPFSTERICERSDYDRVRANFRWECPENFNFGFDVIDAWAADSPEHTALQWVGPETEQRVTYAELANRSGRFARAVAKLPLARGDRVLVILPRIPEWWETLIGLLKAGVVAIPGTTLLTSKDLAYRIELAGVSAVITDTEGAEKIDAIASQVAGLKHRILVGQRTAPAAGTAYEEMTFRAAIAARANGHAARRSGARLLHLGHDRDAENGAAHARQLWHRPPDHRSVLARFAVR